MQNFHRKSERHLGGPTSWIESEKGRHYPCTVRTARKLSRSRTKENAPEARCIGGCGGWCTITPLSRNGNGNGIVSAELEASENFVVCAASKGRKIQNHLICGIARSPKVPDCRLHRKGGRDWCWRTRCGSSGSSKEPNPRRHKTKLRTLIIVGVESRVQSPDPAAAEAAAVVHGVP